MLAAQYLGKETFRLAERTPQRPGPGEVRLDVAYVSNAGTIYRAPVADRKLEEWDNVLEINLTAPFVLAQAIVRTARQFRAWEGGGEYNVARGLRRCFGLRTAVVTALCDNDIGRLIEDLMLAGGVDLRFVRWVQFDGVGRQAGSPRQRPGAHWRFTTGSAAATASRPGCCTGCSSWATCGRRSSMARHTARSR